MAAHMEHLTRIKRSDKKEGITREASAPYSNRSDSSKLNNKARRVCGRIVQPIYPGTLLWSEISGEVNGPEW